MDFNKKATVKYLIWTFLIAWVMQAADPVCGGNLSTAEKSKLY